MLQRILPSKYLSSFMHKKFIHSIKGKHVQIIFSAFLKLLISAARLTVCKTRVLNVPTGNIRGNTGSQEQTKKNITPIKSPAPP
jgi:hypothetical protein